MPFGLAISTERAKALEVYSLLLRSISTVLTQFPFQSAIQDELIKRGYSSEPGVFLVTFEFLKTAERVTDPVMAEYITIMIINNKTRGQFLSNSRKL